MPESCRTGPADRGICRSAGGRKPNHYAVTGDFGQPNGRVLPWTIRTIGGEDGSMFRRAGVDPAVEQVRKLADSLDVPRPWNLATFVAHVAERVGKPILIVPRQDLTTGGFPCGLVVERADDIVIAYDAASTGYHTDHIVMHEIAHLLLDHAGFVSVGAQRRTLATLFPDLDIDSVLRVLARSDYDDIDENQAELFASMLMSDVEVERPRSVLGRLVFRR